MDPVLKLADFGFARALQPQDMARASECHGPVNGLTKSDNVAVAQKTGTQNGTLVSGNVDQNLRSPTCLILSHAHVSFWLLPPKNGGPKMIAVLLP